MTPSGHDSGDPLARIDTSAAHPARRYNYWLGGKDNFAPDRESGDRIAAQFPHVVDAAKENRAFLGRAVQFLDVGTGIPTVDNTHEVAQRITPHSRIVYVDNDPIVLCHARALLTSRPEGAVAYLEHDLRDPAGILADKDLTDTLDLDRPVGLLLVAVLHFIADHDHPEVLIAQLLSALAPGSYLVLSHGTADHLSTEARAVLPTLNAGDPTPFHLRSQEQITGWLGGLDLIDPGVVSIRDWRPADQPCTVSAADLGMYGVVARKP